MKKALLFFLMLYSHLCFSQVWPKIYGKYEAAYSRDVIEMYDKGYLIAGKVNEGYNAYTMHTWLIKTDINGGMLWAKKMVNLNYQQFTNDIAITYDNGCALIGSTRMFNQFDPCISKYNTCFEQEWCTILSSPDNSDYGIKVLQAPDGYICLLSYYQNDIDERVSIVKLDLNGKVQWHKVFLQDDPGFSNEQADDIILTPDGGLLVTTDAYYDPNGSGYGYLHPVLIKTDSLGNEEWVTTWGLNSGYLGFLPRCPLLNTRETISYAGTAHFVEGFGYTASVIKTSMQGTELSYFDLTPGSESGVATTLHFLFPDTLISASTWRMPGESTRSGVIKFDTNANVISSQLLIDNINETFTGSTLTFDNKMILTGGFIKNNPTPDIYLFKVNSSLQLDTLYTTPFEYDYLCPDPIASDTIDLVDCGIYTSLHDPVLEPDVFKLKAYPVPADDFITIELPGELLLEKVMAGITIKTVFHQWDKTTLQVISIQGTPIFEKDLPSSEKQLNLNCQNWKPGIYAIRLIFRGYKVGEVKILVQ